jgi:cytochrome P450
MAYPPHGSTNIAYSPRMAVPPGPPLPAALQLALWLGRSTTFLSTCHERYGEAFTCHFAGLGEIVFISSPDAIREVFTADPDGVRAGEGNRYLGKIVGRSSVLLLDGPAHLRQRRLLMPPLHGERLARYTDEMREITARAMATFPVGRSFPMLPHLQNIGLEVIFRSVFGLENDPTRDRLRSLLASLARASSSWLLFVSKLQIDAGPHSPWGKIVRLREAADEALFAEIARRRSSDVDRGDILTLLLAARDEAGQPMTDRELRDELITLLLAGHETTATALAWALQLVLANPTPLAKVRAEIAAVTSGAAVDASHLARLTYLDAVVKESLRLGPVIPNMARRLRRPLVVGGHEVPARSYVAPCSYLTHLRADLYPEPTRFQPERWLNVKPDPYRFFPFGGGVRRCLGVAFALHEMKVVLATLLAGPALSRASDETAGIRHGGVALAPKSGTRVTQG